MGGGDSPGGVSEPSFGWGISFCNTGGLSSQNRELGKSLKMPGNLESEPGLLQVRFSL